ncbi:MAG: YafY family transcriptional regulator [Clostridia bacterium]|nr:YafY family transcriptional regulator [Clostridia bacterium]
MKYQIMIGILFTLLAKRKVSAGELAGKYGVSVRSIYRYIDEMTIAGIPIDVARGSQGGIFISDAYKLPKGMMTKEEYGKALDAMLTFNEQLKDPVLRSAIDKLSAQVKSEKFDISLSGNILVDCGTWGDERKFSEKLALLERAIQNREVLEIDYNNRSGERNKRSVLPHLLVYKQNIWYVYAYCKMRDAFRLFKVGRIRSIICTEETFERIPFSREDIPLSFWVSEKVIEARFEIMPETLPFAEEWLGIENIREQDGKFFADVQLPDDETLVGTILSVGSGFRVLSPLSLAERVKSEAKKIAESYAS